MKKLITIFLLLVLVGCEPVPKVTIFRYVDLSSFDVDEEILYEVWGCVRVENLLGMRSQVVACKSIITNCEGLLSAKQSYKEWANNLKLKTEEKLKTWKLCK